MIMLAATIGPLGVDRLTAAKARDVPDLAPVKDLPGRPLMGEMKDPRLRPGWESVLFWPKKTLGDLLDFSSPQGRKLLTAYPGLDRTAVVIDNSPGEYGSYLRENWDGAGAPARISINLVANGADKLLRKGAKKADKASEEVARNVYETLLHEGINHAIYAREGANFTQLPDGRKPGDLTVFGYAAYPNEVITDLASKRGVERAFSGRGYADSADFVAEAPRHAIRRIRAAVDTDGSIAQGALFKQDLLEPEFIPAEETVEAPAEAPAEETAEALAEAPAEAPGDILGVNQDAKGGDAGDASPSASKGNPPEPDMETLESAENMPVEENNGPRIVINPKVFTDKRDALCIAFNEAFRLVMEENAFEPVSEPTEKQRRFFADTAYADDELQMRRTILARIATLDTSVSDPTDEQLEETAEMLEMVMEVGAPQNEWEQRAVQRLHDVVVRARGASPGAEPGRETPVETTEGI